MKVCPLRLVGKDVNIPVGRQTPDLLIQEDRWGCLLADCAWFSDSGECVMYHLADLPILLERTAIVAVDAETSD